MIHIVVASRGHWWFDTWYESFTKYTKEDFKYIINDSNAKLAFISNERLFKIFIQAADKNKNIKNQYIKDRLFIFVKSATKIFWSLSRHGSFLYFIINSQPSSISGTVNNMRTIKTRNAHICTSTSRTTTQGATQCVCRVF